MIKEASSIVKMWQEAVGKFGPVTVAFFILLTFLMMMQWSSYSRMEAIHSAMAVDIKVMDGKLDEAKKVNELVVYFLREICRQGAETESERTACNPPPSFTTYSH